VEHATAWARNEVAGLDLAILTGTDTIMNTKRYITVAVILSVLATGANAALVRLGDVSIVQGAQPNDLIGYGLVVGLAGTGDGAAAATRAQERMLRRLQINVASVSELKSDNVSAVIVTAKLPPFVKQGSRIDVLVSSLFDTKSLEGGTLLRTLLQDAAGNTYAVAQGPISTGGFNVDAGGAQTRKNHVTVGRIPRGAMVEREVPARIFDHDSLCLILNRPSFVTAANAAAAINKQFNKEIAEAYTAATIHVQVPEDQYATPIGFVAALEGVRLETGDEARVVINERTGTVIVSGNVTVSPVSVAHGGLTIEVKSTPQVSQPAPFSPEGQTVVTTDDQATVEEETGYLLPVSGATAQELAETLNKLSLSPRDIISVFQALREAGALNAELEIM